MGKPDTTSFNERHQNRAQEIRDWADGVASQRQCWIKRSSYFHAVDSAYLRFLVPERLRILELGCSTGELLAGLNPDFAVGVDISPKMIDLASKAHQTFAFKIGDIENPTVLQDLHELGPYDIIILDSTLGFLSDIQTFLQNLKQLCTPDTRIVITSHSYLWEPLFTIAELFRLRMRTPEITWLKMGDIENFLSQSGFEIVKREWKLLSPYRMLGVGTFLNKHIANLPFVRKLCLRHFFVARTKPCLNQSEKPSATVVIPCRNEKGNIETAVKRLPRFCDQLQIIFVEGHSNDGTWEEIRRIQVAYPQLDIEAIQQPGEGKGDAVRAGFEHATGDILIILDADLTVPPEDLPKFYSAIARGTGEYINGSRLVYAMDSEAMRFLNRLANHFFAIVFSYLLNQDFSDTLCGTKALSRTHYQAISKNRGYFGEFDPFGDFDLIFGAAKLNLKVLEIPIRYARRDYGSTQISRFRHGLLLLRMVVFAYRKLKLI